MKRRLIGLIANLISSLPLLQLARRTLSFTLQRFSPDGRHILSWSSDKSLRLWDAGTGEAIGAPMKHEGPVRGAVYTPDARRILSWSFDKMLKLWDVATAAVIGEPMRHESPARGGLLMQDGKRAVSWSDDGTLRLWDVSWRGANLFEIACNHTPPLQGLKDMDRLLDRYGVSVTEPICKAGVKIPDPDWSRIDSVKTA